MKTPNYAQVLLPAAIGARWALAPPPPASSLLPTPDSTPSPLPTTTQPFPPWGSLLEPPVQSPLPSCLPQGPGSFTPLEEPVHCLTDYIHNFTGCSPSLLVIDNNQGVETISTFRGNGTINSSDTGCTETGPMSKFCTNYGVVNVDILPNGANVQAFDSKGVDGRVTCLTIPASAPGSPPSRVDSLCLNTTESKLTTPEDALVCFAPSPSEPTQPGSPTSTASATPTSTEEASHPSGLSGGAIAGITAACVAVAAVVATAVTCYGRKCLNALRGKTAGWRANQPRDNGADDGIALHELTDPTLGDQEDARSTHRSDAESLHSPEAITPWSALETQDKTPQLPKGPPQAAAQSTMSPLRKMVPSQSNQKLVVHTMPPLPTKVAQVTNART